MRDSYVMLIAELDKTLSIVREMWMESSPESPEKRKAMMRLDQLLDERMRLMRARDAAGLLEKPALPAPVAAPKKKVQRASRSIVLPENPPTSIP